ncbi:hypothetical protein N7532_002862 [Penicillium argentinense]|uniref:AA1-like domain-containing protein n=1 Tax=Penicillium argentinense TaxID=1131581 RepID=A0A9W9G196_9EURO|nr:uncharacterized protein N7532_002862 [Penicillium argentinense]KAJ5110217.1 hypothetical protein N7532_002862 [Penicillium argentinense]
MKTAAISTVLLAAASTAIVPPSNFKRVAKRDSQALQLRNLNGRIFDEWSPATTFINFALTDPNAGVSADCGGSWSAEQGNSHKWNCTGNQYLLDFPKGIDSLESFYIRVSSPGGSLNALGQVGGASWQCKERTNQTSPLSKTCNWVGVYNLEV